MTEREAWLFVADDFDQMRWLEPTKDYESRSGCATIGGVLSVLHAGRRLGAATATAMIAKAHWADKRGWSKGDMRARAEFCRERAREAKGDETKAQI